MPERPMSLERKHHYLFYTVCYFISLGCADQTTHIATVSRTRLYRHQAWIDRTWLCVASVSNSSIGHTISTSRPWATPLPTLIPSRHQRIASRGVAKPRQCLSAPLETLSRMAIPNFCLKRIGGEFNFPKRHLFSPPNAFLLRAFMSRI